MEQTKNTQILHPLGLASLVVVSTVLMMFWKARKNAKKNKEKHGGRRISFTSAVMAMNSFPEERNVCDPIINACLFFEDCPCDDDMMKVIDVMLEYERCAGIPTPGNGKNDWSFEKCLNVDREKFIRRIEMDGDDKELHKLIEENFAVNLRSSERNLPWWEILVIQNNGPSGMSAVIIRIEHTVSKFH